MVGRVVCGRPAPRLRWQTWSAATGRFHGFRGGRSPVVVAAISAGSGRDQFYQRGAVARNAGHLRQTGRRNNRRLWPPSSANHAIAGNPLVVGIELGQPDIVVVTAARLAETLKAKVYFAYADRQRITEREFPTALCSTAA